MAINPGFDWGRGPYPANTGVHTLSDYPLLIGEVLRRHELRSARRAKRRALVQKIGRTLGIRYSELHGRRLARPILMPTA